MAPSKPPRTLLLGLAAATALAIALALWGSLESPAPVVSVPEGLGDTSGAAGGASAAVDENAGAADSEIAPTPSSSAAAVQALGKCRAAFSPEGGGSLDD